jgi:hypothetical protein
MLWLKLMWPIFVNFVTSAEYGNVICITIVLAVVVLEALKTETSVSITT